MVGCTFATKFESQAIEELGGATISGSPTFDKGIVLDGTNDYIKYALDGHEFYSDEISIEQEFWPNFATDEDTIRFLFDSTLNSTYSMYKHSHAYDNILVLNLGNQAIAHIPEATYSPHWKINERNVLQISSNGTTTNVRLNKNLILSGGNAWTKKAPTEFSIGAKYSGHWKFKGKIGPVKVYQSILRERDHYNTVHNCAYGFRNGAVFDLPMTAACHDVANTRTLDVSGNYNHAVWTAGATAPTKGDRRGYYWDGGDHMVAPATGIFNKPEVGIVTEFTPHFPTDLNASCFIFDSTTGSRYFAEKCANAAANVLRIYLGNTQIAIIAEATYKPYWRQGERNLLVVSGESEATDVHLNEGLILDADNTAWTAKDPVNLVIGANQGTANRFLGNIHSMMIFDKLITPRMAADLRHDRINSIGEV